MAILEINSLQPHAVNGKLGGFRLPTPPADTSRLRNNTIIEDRLSMLFSRHWLDAHYITLAIPLRTLIAKSVSWIVLEMVQVRENFETCKLSNKIIDQLKYYFLWNPQSHFDSQAPGK